MVMIAYFPITSWMCVFLFSLRNEVVTCGSRILGNSTVEAQLGHDAAMKWKLEPAEKKKPTGAMVLTDNISGRTLWKNTYHDKIDTPENEELKDLKVLFGDRVTISRKLDNENNLMFILTIRKVNFTDSCSLNLKASFSEGSEVFAKHDEILNRTVSLRVLGMELISADLKKSYSFEEGRSPEFSLTIAAVPALNVVWTISSTSSSVTSRREVLDRRTKQYKYWYKLSRPLEAKDCGSTLTYKTEQKGNGVLSATSKIIVRVTPPKVVVTSAKYKKKGGKICIQIEWNAVSIGRCIEKLTYIVEILNGTKPVTYPNLRAVLLETCHVTHAKNATVRANFDGRNGIKSDIIVFNTSISSILSTTKSTTSTSSQPTAKSTMTTTIQPSSPKVEEKQEKEQTGKKKYPTGHIVGVAIGGAVVLAVGVILIMFIKKTHEVVSVSTGSISSRRGTLTCETGETKLIT